LGDQEAFKGDHHVLTVGTLACNTGPNGHDAGNFQSNQGVDSGYVIPVAFTQNSRDEVRVIGDDGLVSGSLSAETGTHQTTYITMIEQNTQASTPELPSIRANETPNYAVAFALHGGGKDFTEFARKHNQRRLLIHLKRN
jgi:hypothetical protein